MLGGGAGVLVALVLARLAGERLLHRRSRATRGVVLTFGRYAEETNPGLRWRLP